MQPMLLKRFVLALAVVAATGGMSYKVVAQSKGTSAGRRKVVARATSDDPLRYLSITTRFAQVCADQLGQMAYLSNSDPRQIQGDIEQTTYIEPLHQVLSVQVMNLHPVVSQGFPAPIDCTTRADLRDINNPKRYSYTYKPVGARYVPIDTGGGGGGGGGGRGEGGGGGGHREVASCLAKAPVIDDCGSVPVEGGAYRLRAIVSTTITILSFRFTIFDTPWCVDVASPGGRFQQLDCRDVVAQRFDVSPKDGQGCYIFKTGEQHRLMAIKENQGTKSEILGLGETQVVPPGCPFSIDKTRWQLKPVPSLSKVYQIVNKATGLCLDLDGGNVRAGGIVQGLDCRNIENQQWRLDPQ